MTNELDLILRKFHTEKYPEYQTLCVLPSKESSLLVYLISTNRPYCGHSTQSFSHKLDTSQFDVLVDFDEFWDYEKSMEVIVRHGEACNATGRASIKPQPAPQYKVGDWVEFIDAGSYKSQGKYLSDAYENTILVLDTIYNVRCVVPTSKITRKLDPSEVIVKIGCLKGTVTYAISDDCFLLAKVYDPQHRACCINMSMLDIPTRELVESLLRAQEEK